MVDLTKIHTPVKCEICVVRHKAICGSLSEADLVEFNKIAHMRHLGAGQVIATEDDVVFANLVSGVIKLTKTIVDGRQQIVGLLFPPDFLGRTYSDSTHFFAEAVTDVELCAFSKAGFERMLQRFPDLEHRLFEHTLDELDSARDWMLLLGRKTARERVASLLLMIATRAMNAGCHHSPDHKFARFTLPLSRADFADYLGLTLETVSRQITHLRKQGIIELIDNREIIVPDIEALEDASAN